MIFLKIYVIKGYAKSPVRIERNVWICAGVMITKGTIIGENSVIVGNSVARGSLRQNSIYAGIPVSLLKKFHRDKLYVKRKCFLLFIVSVFKCQASDFLIGVNSHLYQKKMRKLYQQLKSKISWY